MHKPSIENINKAWPEDELEDLEACPYCSSKQRQLAYGEVQDWTFYCAPGKWKYWDCSNCGALYLSPRPTERSIGKAYGMYYTHNSAPVSFVQRYKIRLKNECFFHWVGVNIQPRLNLPKAFSCLLNLLRRRITIPFHLEQIALLPKGKLLDVGCGNGDILILARQLGWEVAGLEVDAKAVNFARGRGLNVIEGDFRRLEAYASEFDCIVCGHVLEHVHHPLNLLELITNALRDNGTLLLSLPNSKSRMRKLFGDSWRGIEAPRHLAIPSATYCMELLSKQFRVVKQIFAESGTYESSLKIFNERMLGCSAPFEDVMLREFKLSAVPDCDTSDFILIVATK